MFEASYFETIVNSAKIRFTGSTPGNKNMKAEQNYSRLNWMKFITCECWEKLQAKRRILPVNKYKELHNRLQLKGRFRIQVITNQTKRNSILNCFCFCLCGFLVLFLQSIHVCLQNVGVRLKQDKFLSAMSLCTCERIGQNAERHVARICVVGHSTIESFSTSLRARGP